MNPLGFSAILQTRWSAIGAPLANHLWQSTLFAVAVALLAFLLRKNHARTRYSLWLLASLKFLIPFSLLVAAGSYFGWSSSPAAPQTEFILVIEDFSQPFLAAGSVLHIARPAAPSLSLAARTLPIFLLLVWSFGFAAVLLYWWRRSRHMAAAIHGAQPVGSSREIALLRYLEGKVGITRQTRLIYSNSALEPGIVGIFRSVLLLPAGISDRLTEAELQSILTHELCHVRRRDNLAAALHMLVEALCWFHPLVWWLGARLLDERERACDEEVLHLGSDRQTYAESILKICEFYLEFPLVCAAGVTGSNLKKRIEAIMQGSTPLSLNFARKLLLVFSAFLAVAVPFSFGLLHAAQTGASNGSQSQSQFANSSRFEYSETSIKPNDSGKAFGTLGHGPQPGFTDKNVTLRTLIRIAYDVQDAQILGGPEWIGSNKYDIEAKMDKSSADEMKKLSREQLVIENKRMLRNFLADHFRLAVHRETRELPVYALVVADGGAKMSRADSINPPVPSGFPIVKGSGIGIGTGKLTARAASTSFFVDILSRQPEVNRIVVDKTGLTDSYDFTLAWTSDVSTATPTPTLFTALEQQLGLKLKPQEGPVEIVVIDHAEKAAESLLSQPQP